jgi:hypothetical protein
MSVCVPRKLPSQKRLCWSGRCGNMHLFWQARSEQGRECAQTEYRGANAIGAASNEAHACTLPVDQIWARRRPKEQIRAQLLAEYAKRGILPPPEPLFDNIVKLMITDDPGERTMLLREQREIGLELARLVGGQVATLKRLFSELDETGDEGEEEVDQ